jgi:hypothetical protein
MTAVDRPADATARDAAPPLGVRARIFVYVGGLVVLANLASPAAGLMDVPISFFLKNKLHLSAHEVAGFRFVAATPLYLSCGFGFARDLWVNAGRGDRGFLALFASICAGLYGGFAFVPMDSVAFLGALVLLTAASLFVTGAQNGLVGLIGRRTAMPGRISAVWNSFWSISTVGGLAVGGALADGLEASPTPEAMRPSFLVGAGLMAAIALYALWRPAAVFDRARPETRVPHAPSTELLRLLAHRPIYPALGIWLMWCFAPGSATPLQYFLQNQLGGRDMDWGIWNAIFFVSLTPTFILYGVLCRHWPPRRLLLWVTLVAIPQFVPMLFISSVDGALLAAVPIGLMGGAATAAYTDLLIRAAPRGLQGTTLMLASGFYYIAARLGDVVGTAVFDATGSFLPCVILIILTYALILPVLRRLPATLVADTDGTAP